jgi:hypothetical protein
MGSSAAWHLAARGERVTLFEQFTPCHDRGSSHGSSRIFRLAQPDPFHVALAVRALPLRRRLEEETGRRLLELTGAVDHGPAEATRALHDALAAAGRPSEFLTPAQVAERWQGGCGPTPAPCSTRRRDGCTPTTRSPPSNRRHGEPVSPGPEYGPWLTRHTMCCSIGYVNAQQRLVTRDHIDFGRVWSAACCT